MSVRSSQQASIHSDHTKAHLDEPQIHENEPSSDTSTSVSPDVEKQLGSTGKALDSAAQGVEVSSSDPYLVRMDGPFNAKYWSHRKKMSQTLLVGVATFVVTFASSAYSAGVLQIAGRFNISPVVATLGISLFVLGFAFGPVLWGPASEAVGRKAPFVAAYFLFAIFSIPVAVARNVETVMLGRFFGGLFGSAALAIVPGFFVDFWPLEERVGPLGLYAGAVFAGPTLGPVIGSAIATTGDNGWRHIQWFILGAGLLLGFSLLFFMEESFGLVLAQREARRLRFETKNWAWHSWIDTVQASPKSFATRYLTKPIIMLACEPLLICITVYLSFVYGILYLQFSAIPLIYQGHRGMKPVVAALPFLSFLVGVIIAIIIIRLDGPRYSRVMAAAGGKLVPEERFVIMMVGAVAFTVGLAWFAWTADPLRVSSPWPSIVALLFVGCGLIMIFLQGINAIVDIYTFSANSAMAANTLVRSMVAAGFPLFTRAFISNLGIAWSMMTLAFIALALTPIPFVFYRYGPKLRQISRFAPTKPVAMPDW